MKKISKVLSPKQIVETIKQRAKKFLDKVNNNTHNKYNTMINEYNTPEQQKRIEKDFMNILDNMERINI